MSWRRWWNDEKVFSALCVCVCTMHELNLLAHWLKHSASVSQEVYSMLCIMCAHRNSSTSLQLTISDTHILRIHGTVVAVVIANAITYRVQWKSQAIGNVAINHGHIPNIEICDEINELQINNRVSASMANNPMEFDSKGGGDERWTVRPVNTGHLTVDTRQIHDFKWLHLSSADTGAAFDGGIPN